MENYNYYKILTIPPHDEALTDFQVKVELDNTSFDFSHAESDGKDIKFTAADGVTELPHWKEEYDAENETATIWVLIPSISDSEDTVFQMWYGNASAVDSSNGNNTFIAFEGFNNTDGWSAAYGDVSQLSCENGIGTLDVTTGYDGTRKDILLLKSLGSTVNRNVIVESKLTPINIVDWIGLGLFTNAINGNGYIWGHWGWAGTKASIETYNGYTTGTKLPEISQTIGSVGNDYRQKVIIKSGTLEFFDIDGITSIGILTQSTYTSFDYLALRGNMGSIHDRDWVLIRKYATTEPTVSIGSEIEMEPPIIIFESSNLYSSNSTYIAYAEITDVESISTITIQRNEDDPIEMTKVEGSVNVYSAEVSISIGTNYLTITAIDVWGNTATSQTKTVVGLEVSDDRPIVTITSTHETPTTENHIDIVCTVASDVVTYVKAINSKLAGTTELTATGNPHEYAGSVPLAYNDNIIYIEAMGEVGWYGKSASIAITRNSIGPELSLASASEVLPQSYNLVVNVTDDVDIDTVTLNYNGSAYPMTSIGSNQYSVQIYLEDYTNTLTVTATDVSEGETTDDFSVTLLSWIFDRTTEKLITYQRKTDISADYLGEYPATAITMKLNGETQELTQENGKYIGTLYLRAGINTVLWNITDSAGNDLQVVDAVLLDTDGPIVSFKNGNDDELTFASNDKAEFIINSLPGLNAVKTKYSTAQSLGQQGVTITGKNEEALNFTINVILSIQNSSKTMTELVREVSKVFNPNFGQGFLIYQDYENNIYELPCHVRIPKLSMTPEDRTETTRLFSAEVTAPNPYFKLKPAITSLIGYKVPKWTIPFTLPIIFSEKIKSVIINNDGHSDVPIVIRYFGTATNPVLQNETSGETLKLNATLKYNEYFEVSTDLMNIYAKVVNIDTGEETDAFNYLDINYMDFFKLYIGNNTISFETDDESENAYVEIEYNKKYGVVE